MSEELDYGREVFPGSGGMAKRHSSEKGLPRKVIILREKLGRKAKLEQQFGAVKK